MLTAIKDADYDARYGLVLKALTLANMCGYEAGIRIDPKEPEWPMAFIGLPTGQVSWHLPQYKTPYDGHATEEKYSRIAEFAKWAEREDALYKLGEISEELGLYDDEG